MSGPECCQNPPTLSSSSGAGSVVELGGLKTYITGPSDSKLAVLLVSDVFGHEAPNLRKLADKVGAAGFFVAVPDFFYGDPYVPDNAEKPIPIWMKSHGADKGFEDAKPVIAALRSKGITAIGAAGFCWGGCCGASQGCLHSSCGAFTSFPCHYNDIKEVKVPIAVLGAEVDKISPPELLKQFDEILSTKPEVNSYVKIFPGVVHGWTVRYSVEDEKAVKCAEEAHQNMLDWFIQYVK